MLCQCELCNLHALHIMRSLEMSLSQTRTVWETKHRRRSNPRRNQAKMHRKAKSRAASKQTQQ